MVEVRKKEGESAASLVRRFSYRMQKSGILLRAKKIKHRQKPKTKRERKMAALRRLKRQFQ
ncbi:MAG: 30S ribosomal protein S21 [Parcubacteria group bacterium CG11_big_fil_rev_8_21_14_0_20_39_14]|nr:MAG: 30S ribosomal protein S21 [Parcubacteria group bacterium CG11_big_fil_rev_8_21_14_0_20_39_14]PIS35469.1 MAG: 30S ribosomal protein S21 [Parcubacteria group bacterium CG08_land_8_20_14_0_20_38_56]